MPNPQNILSVLPLEMERVQSLVSCANVTNAGEVSSRKGKYYKQFSIFNCPFPTHYSLNHIQPVAFSPTQYIYPPLLNANLVVPRPSKYIYPHYIRGGGVSLVFFLPPFMPTKTFSPSWILSPITSVYESSLAPVLISIRCNFSPSFIHKP